MRNTIYQSFSEVYNIIMHMSPELYRKIPKNFIEMLEKTRDTNYKPNIDYHKSINEQYLLHETRVILSLIYRDYLCSPEEKARLREKENVELRKKEQELRKQYHPDIIFYHNQLKDITAYTEQIKINDNSNLMPTLVKKDGILRRIINFITNIFKKQ